MKAFLVIFAASSFFKAVGANGVDDLSRPCVLNTIRLVVKHVYDNGGIQVEQEPRIWHQRGRDGSIIRNSVVSDEDLETCFAVDRYCVETFYNSFEVHGIKGHIFSVRHDHLSNKIFIGFPGTQDSFAWFKNLFRVDCYDNIQRSYVEDVGAIFQDGLMSLPQALERHMVMRQREGIGRDLPPEYFFVGHSRGGSLALLAAERFKRDHLEAPVKVFTFSAPKLSNAFARQVDLLQMLGFWNVVHFSRPLDIAPYFPFPFLKNFGVKVPLVKAHISPLGSHSIPSKKEFDESVAALQSAKALSLSASLKSLIFPLEVKSVVWIGIGCIAGFLVAKKDIFGEILRKTKGLSTNLPSSSDLRTAK